MTHLSLEDVKDLLDVQNILGTPGQLERLRRWMQSIVDRRGKDFVRENRQNLLEQWEQHMGLKTFECC